MPIGLIVTSSIGSIETPTIDRRGVADWVKTDRIRGRTGPRAPLAPWRDQRWPPATQTLFLEAPGGVAAATGKWCWHAPTYRRTAAATCETLPRVDERRRSAPATR